MNKSRKERMVEFERQIMVPSYAESFEVIDYTEMKPGVISILTYSYVSSFSDMRTRTARWAAWSNDHKLSSGVLYTDFLDKNE